MMEFFQLNHNKSQGQSTHDALIILEVMADTKFNVFLINVNDKKHVQQYVHSVYYTAYI